MGRISEKNGTHNAESVPTTIVLSDRGYWKHLGRCTECHRVDAFTMNGRSLCGVCADKARLKKANEYAFDKQKILSRNRDAYQRRKANGLCVKCGKPIEEGNYRVRCLKCTAKLSYSEKIKASEKAARGDNGICYMCNRNPVLPDKRCCAECYPKLQINMLKAQSESTNKRKENIWTKHTAKTTENACTD